MKPSVSRVSREAGVSPRSARVARAGLGGAGGGTALVARGWRAVWQARSLGLRATRDSGSMRAVPPTSAPTPRTPSTPNQALQRTAGLAVSVRGGGSRSTGSVTGCAACHEAPAHPAPSPPAAVLPRAASGPQSLSLGSLGHYAHIPHGTP